MARMSTTFDPVAVLMELETEGRGAAVPAGSGAYKFTKRILDVLVSLALILLLFPFFVLIGVLIKLASRGPVIFKQTRAGIGEKPFTMFKFRTMHVGAEEDQDFLSHLNYQNGPVFKALNDPRLIWSGKFLRRSSIDELPQLFNVLVGRMSLVGPRPLWLPEAQKARGPARLRTQVKPGLTCLWQISGRSELSYEQWVLLDLYYIRRRSFLLDLLIIIQTVPAVLSGHGAY